MLSITKLSLKDKLPLTCSRTGTCCHGKDVNLNPWELAKLAEAKKLTSRKFRDQYTLYGGIRLAFDGAPGWKDLPECSQYITDFGCSVHLGRPLACRLYPLGRQRQRETITYIHEGKIFPCLEGCPEVVDLPQLTVEEYIQDQNADSYLTAEDQYLELMQSLADVAFTLLLETGLAASGDTKTLAMWDKLGSYEPENIVIYVGKEWLERLMLPDLPNCLNDPVEFAAQHYNLLQDRVQEVCNVLDNADSISETSSLMMALALHLGRGLGANPADLAEHWIKIAIQNGGNI